MKELLEVLARPLVDKPDAIEVSRKDEGNLVILQLRVAPEDMGKVIGKQGRIAKAIRTIIKAGAAREEEGKKVIVDIVQ